MEQTKRLNLPPLTKTRSQEEESLRKAFESVRCNGSVQMVLIGGPWGTGKSQMMEQFLATAQQNGGAWCASVHLTKQQAPFAALQELLVELFRATLHPATAAAAAINNDAIDDSTGEATGSKSLCAALQRELTPHQQQVLGHFVPSATCLLATEAVQNGYSAACMATDISPDKLNVLISTIRASIRVIAGMAPVLFCVHDLTASDKATLEVIQAVLSDETLKNLMLVATYTEETIAEGSTSSSTTNPECPFWKLKERLQQQFAAQNNRNFQEICLTDLDLPALQALLAEATNLEVDQVQDLAETIYKLTHGNYFFTEQLLESLQDEHLLVFDTQQFRWTWKLEQIKRRSSITDNVLQTLKRRLDHQPKSVHRVLQLASCFGARFDVRALEATQSAIPGMMEAEDDDGFDLYRCLQEAVQQEFVVKINDTQYKFSHELIQMAAYGKFGEDQDMNEIHYRIGCLLLNYNHGALVNSDDAIFFACVDHLNLGAAQCCVPEKTHKNDNADAQEPYQDPEHCMDMKLAELNYQAGAKAAGLSSFEPASQYFKEGIDVLGSTPFQRHYDLALKLYEFYAKSEQCIGHLESSKEAAQAVLDQTSSCAEKEFSFFVLLSCLKAENQLTELVDICLRTLNHLGESLPKRPNSLQVKYEYKKTERRLKRLSEQDILSLPRIQDKQKEMAVKVLFEMTIALYQLEQELLSTLVICRMVALTLKYGVCEATPEVFTTAGAFIISKSTEIKEGYRLGKIAKKLLEERPNESSTNRHAFFYVVAANNCQWWLEPIPQCLDQVIYANEIAMRNGDVGDAFQASVAYCVIYFYSGLDLEPLLQDVEKFGFQMLEYNHRFYYLMLAPIWQCLLNLTARSENPHSMDEGIAITQSQQMENTRNQGQQSTWSFGMQISFYLGDLAKATELMEKVKRATTGIMNSSVFVCVRSFFYALISISNYRVISSNSIQKRKYKSEAERHIQFFRKVVKAGAINLVHKLQLLEAELLSLNCKNCEDVLCMYDNAVVSATRTGFLQDAAFANYLCFEFIRREKVRPHMSELYLKKSFELWKQWGAHAVADSLVQRHPDLLNAESSTNSGNPSRHSSSSYRSRTRFDASLSEQHKQLNI